MVLVRSYYTIIAQWTVKRTTYLWNIWITQSTASSRPPFSSLCLVIWSIAELASGESANPGRNLVMCLLRGAKFYPRQTRTCGYINLYRIIYEPPILIISRIDWFSLAKFNISDVIAFIFYYWIIYWILYISYYVRRTNTQLFHFIFSITPFIWKSSSIFSFFSFSFRSSSHRTFN